MAENTKIEWADYEFFPWKDHGDTRRRASDDYWKKPLKWNREAELIQEAFIRHLGKRAERPRVFCASLADVFEDLPLKVWKEVATGYRVSIYGEVQSCRQIGAGSQLDDEWHTVNGERSSKGYVRVKINGRRKAVHRLVLEAFVGPCPDGCETRHLDGNPSNNSLWNLLYGTASENWNDRRQHGTASVGSQHASSKLTEQDVAEIKAAHDAGETQVDIAERYGVSNSLVHLIVTGKAWRGHSNAEPDDLVRHCSVGHVVDHKNRPLFRCECCNDQTIEPGVCKPCSQERGPLTLDDLRRDLFALIDATPNLDWLLLTKRPESVSRMWLPHPDGGANEDEALYRHNVGLGTSVSLQEHADKQIPELLKCRDLCPVLFVSAEPLLEPIEVHQYLHVDSAPECRVCGEIECNHTYLDWVIAGGESGPNARPCNVEWIRSIRDQCSAASVAFFCKQLGAHVIDRGATSADTTDPRTCWPDPVCERYRSGVFDHQHRIPLADAKGGDPDEWPEDLRVRQFPEPFANKEPA